MALLRIADVRRNGFDDEEITHFVAQVDTQRRADPLVPRDTHAPRSLGIVLTSIDVAIEDQTSTAMHSIVAKRPLERGSGLRRVRELDRRPFRARARDPNEPSPRARLTKEANDARNRRTSGAMRLANELPIQRA
jgi:hypothetical protein